MIHVDEVIKATKGSTVSDVLLSQYRAVYPDFDDEQKFPNKVPFPKANEKTNIKIIRAAKALLPNYQDRESFVFTWMNNGFSVDNSIEDDIVLRGDE